MSGSKAAASFRILSPPPQRPPQTAPVEGCRLHLRKPLLLDLNAFAGLDHVVFTPSDPGTSKGIDTIGKLENVKFNSSCRRAGLLEFLHCRLQLWHGHFLYCR